MTKLCAFCALPTCTADLPCDQRFMSQARSMVGVEFADATDRLLSTMRALNLHKSETRVRIHPETIAALVARYPIQVGGIRIEADAKVPRDQFRIADESVTTIERTFFLDGIDAAIDKLGARPRPLVVLKTNAERERMGLPTATTAKPGPVSRLWARLSRAIRFSVMLVATGCAHETIDPALGRACEPDAPDVVERCRFEDTPEGRCGGTCTITCSRDEECPAGSACDVAGGGGCRWPCEVSVDCPDLDVARCAAGFCTAGIGL